MEYYPVIQENETVPATYYNVDGPGDDYTKRSKRERQISRDVTYMQVLKVIQVSLYANQIHRHRKQTYGYQREEGRMDKLEVHRSKLLYIKDKQQGFTI